MPRNILDVDFSGVVDNTAAVEVEEDELNVLDDISMLPGVHDFDLTQPSVMPSSNSILRLELITNCPRCNKPLFWATAVNGAESTTFKDCRNCGTLINTFKPTYYQAAFLRRRERYKMTAGGYGTGKSRINIEDVIKHLLLIPGSRVCVAARTYPVLAATFEKEFYSMFPAKLVRRKNDTKHEMTLTNGSELLMRSFDDETKLKSMNLSMVVIIEASDIPKAGFTMMQSRLRNTAAMIPHYHPDGRPVMVWDVQKRSYRPKWRIDARHINLETNPDSGWVKKDFLLDSETVEFYGDAYNEGYKFNNTKDKNKYIQVVSTSANPYLPDTYEEEQTRGKSLAYIQQFYKGSFNFSSNLVFPNVGTRIVAPHALPRAFDESGKRVLYYLIGLDYGVNDPTHVVYSAFSFETRKLYVFAEMRINNSDIKTIAKEHRKTMKQYGIPYNGLLTLPAFDGKSFTKRESDLQTIGSAFQDEGLYFDGVTASHEIRIIKLNAMVNHEQIELYSNCEFLIDELLNYKWKLDKNGNPTGSPVDGNDHGITALEFLSIALPNNLVEVQLSYYLPPGTRIVHDKQADIKKTSGVYNPLQEERNDRNYPNSNLMFNVCDHGDTAHVSSVYDSNDADETGDIPRLRAYIPR